jgi:Fur family transcriptional regulator, ferric uptake regulator
MKSDRREQQRSLETLRARVRERGGRITPQREVVLEALHRLPEHVTAEDILADINDAHPNINLTTIYRTLELFEELGIVYHAHMGHGPGSYHLSSRGSHNHLVCERCGKEIDADIRSLARVEDEVMALHGFEVDFSHFAVTGTCCECRMSAERHGQT